MYNILSLLRTYSCFQSLPKDIRTLLGTPRNKVVISKIHPNEYIHFELEMQITKILLQFPVASLPNQIEIDFNTDGCNLDKYYKKESKFG